MTRIARPEVAEEAREWVDTPFQWGQSLKGVACDCKGLIAGVARECGLPEGNNMFALEKGYRHVDEDRLLFGLRQTFLPVSPLELFPGDILVLRVGGKAQHLGIVSETENGGPYKLIHTYNNGPRCVREIVMGSMVGIIDSCWGWQDGN